MKKVLAIAAAAIIVAAAGVGIGLWSFGTASQKNLPNSTTQESTANNLNNSVVSNNQTANGEEIPVQDIFYTGLVDQGYPPALASLASSDPEILAKNNTNQHYIWYLGGGGYRDLNISLAPVKNYNHTEGEQPFTLPDGTDMYVTNSNIKTYSSSYNFTMNFFIPMDKMSTQMKQDLGIDSVQPVASHSIFDVQYAQAIDVLPEGGIVGQVSESFGLEDTGLNRLQISKQTVTPSGVDLTRDLGEYYQETKQFVNEGSRLQDEIRVREFADKVKSDIAAKQAAREAAAAEQAAAREATELAKASKIQAGLGAVQIALTGLEVKNIVDQADQTLNKLLDLLDCAEHPTNPLAIKAQKEDPNYNRSTVEVIKNAIAEVKGISAARIIVTTTGSALGTGTGVAGNVLVGGITMTGSKMLLDTINNHIMPDVGKGVVPCDKCKDTQTSSPSPTDSGQNYTPADNSGQNYSPGPGTQPASEVCLPTDNQLRVLIHYSDAGYSDSGNPSHTVTFTATATVTDLFPAGNGMMMHAPDNRFEGTGTGLYHEAHYGSDCDISTEGDATMKVTIRKNSDNPAQLVDVHVVLSGPLPITQSPEDCAGDWPTSTGNDDIYTCNFSEVNQKGGQYMTGDSEFGVKFDDYDDCELYLGKLVPSPA